MATGLGRGVLLRGTVWPGGNSEPFDGAVVVDSAGDVAYLGPDVAVDVPVVGAPGCWIGPGVVDAHVHLAFGSPEQCRPAGLVGVRDLGAPLEAAQAWRADPAVAIAGPILTAPGGYPSRSWGADGFAAGVAGPDEARAVVRRLAADVDVIKLALEPGRDDWPVPEPDIVRAVVDAAHAAGRAVVAHALTTAMVRRALDGGVDELAHVPTERLPEDVIDRIAAAGVGVVSTLQTFRDSGEGAGAAANAAALHRAGVELRYGTDLGNAGTRPGIEPRELDRLAEAGLGRLGALRAATEASARAPGVRGRTGRLRLGERAALVVLPADPIGQPEAWRTPLAVLADRSLHMN